LTVNVTRAHMVRAGWSPSVRLFEAAACAVPVLSDPWPGLGEIFSIGREVLVESAERALSRSREELAAIGARARERVLREHTAEHRAAQLEDYVREAQEMRVRA
jgi:spore maturation protein CgeB